MKTHYVYILTDCNRTQLQTGVSTHVRTAISRLKQQACIAPDSTGYPVRLVYCEPHCSEAEALRRLTELKSFTRAQYERLVRKHNANWVDLSLHTAWLSGALLSA